MINLIKTPIFQIYSITPKEVNSTDEDKYDIVDFANSLKYALKIRDSLANQLIIDKEGTEKLASAYVSDLEDLTKPTVKDGLYLVKSEQKIDVYRKTTSIVPGYIYNSNDVKFYLII